MNDFLKVVVYGGLFAIPFLTLYVANDYFFPFITGKNFALRIIVEIVFGAWAVLCLLDAKYRPKFSWLLTSFSALLIVMFFANLLGEHPQTSFWSNFERMDGYVTLVHIFLYALVLGSVLTTKKAWNWYLHMTLLAALITALYGIAQYTGVVEGAEGRRIESYLGNAAYLSIYMFFHIFIAFWMFVESKVTLHRIIYVLLAALFTYALMNSGTRGTVLGLGVGLGVMVTYVMLFGAKYQEFRKYAIGAFVFLLLGAGMFVLGKDTEFVQGNPNLARVANINLSEDLKVRGTIWGMAWEGVQERPVLGWGMGNFNYVFNLKYKPFLYDQEQWFDRSHNIIMDWLIAGGFLGLIAYLSIFGAALYYLFIQPLLNKDDETFTALERGVLLGMLAGYFTHNLVVFDNIVSYMFFGLILALMHSRVGKGMPKVEKFKMDQPLIMQFVAPVVLVLVAATIYTVNVPGMQAASDIIEGYQATTAADKLAAFKAAAGRHSFAQQEVAEQIAQQAMGVIREPNVSTTTKQEYVTFAEIELRRLAEDKPGDARVHVFIGSFYRAIGDLEAASTQMDLARQYSPNKQSIISQQAIVAYSQGDLEKSRDLFGEAFKLDERNAEAREFYTALLFMTGDTDGAHALITDGAVMIRASLNDFLYSAALQAKDNAFVIELYKARIALYVASQAGEVSQVIDLYKNRIAGKPAEVEQDFASLAYLYNQMGDTKAAVETLRQAAEVRPGFAKAATCIADNIEAGRAPEEGC
jgi:O-antigen ligase/tetratricopeptide (TPR) repeat protein